MGFFPLFTLVEQSCLKLLHQEQARLICQRFFYCETVLALNTSGSRNHRLEEGSPQCFRQTHSNCTDSFIFNQCRSLDAQNKLVLFWLPKIICIAGDYGLPCNFLPYWSNPVRGQERKLWLVQNSVLGIPCRLFGFVGKHFCKSDFL